MPPDDRQLHVWFCTGCGNCCRWPGDVKVNDAEIARIAAYLGMDESAFIARYTRMRYDRRGLSITDQENGACAMLDSATNRCTINDVKPQQCRDFPNKWNHTGFEAECAALKIRTHIRRARPDDLTPDGYATPPTAP